jgi:hypothetical protein
MSWREDWLRLSARIRGLVEGSGRFLPQNANEYAAMHHDIVLRARKTFGELENFYRVHKTLIPRAAGQCLEEFEMLHGVAFRQQLPAMCNSVDAITSLSVLDSLRVELNDLLKDREEIAKSLAARAFAHLQRSIVADESLQARWVAKFEGTHTAETECEKLGGVHLLLFGIFAFKVNAAGERTDLVFQQPIKEAEVQRTSEALVLTEWKILKENSNLDNLIDRARLQVAAYQAGALAGLELWSRRYLVMVSRDFDHRLPKEIADQGVTYEVINIAVAPSSPSTRAVQIERKSRPARKG